MGPPPGRARIRPPQGVGTTGRPGPAWRCGIVNRTQALAIGFFATVLVVLIGILVLAPGTYDEALSLPAGALAMLAGYRRAGVWGG